MGRALFWLVTAAFLGAILYLNVLPRFGPEPRAQPMRFSHKAHFEESTCEGCHVYVMEHRAAGTPTLENCLDCHDGVQSEKPEDQKEEEKLIVYEEEEREIPWVPLPPLPPNTYFSHYRHATLEEVECATCHGDIAESLSLPGNPPYEFTMKWCMDCHEEHEASNDCLLCHR
ncbi:MAG: cytochrome c3 family protein [Deltaproteobacteria bacterium]|nr:cytochrome c3 family protein [Deltaproteobacteria bacterium]